MASAIAKETKLTEIPEELVTTIIQLREKKYSIEHISRIIRLEPGTVSRVLLNNLTNSTWMLASSIALLKSCAFESPFDEIGYEKLRKEFLTVLREILEKAKQRGRFTVLDKLLPVIAYLFLKSKGYEVKKSDLMRGTGVTKKEFSRRLIYIASIFPTYQNRDKARIVLTKLQRVQAHFNLSDDFAQASLELFRSFYPRLKATTESVVAGAICVLTALDLEIEKPTCRDICKFLRIGESSVHYNLKRKIFSGVKLKGLVSSRDVIKDILRARPESIATSTIDLRKKGKGAK